MAVATACTGDFGVSTDWLVIIVLGSSIGEVWISVAFLAAGILIICPLSPSVACINPIGITPGCAASRCPFDSFPK
jgi:threonine/homoserine efflux transporter RhtA